MPDLVPPLAADARFSALAQIQESRLSLDLTRLLLYRLDSVQPDVLPFLAEQFHVLGHEGWLLAGDDVDKQRALLKSAIRIHRRKGTRWAIEQIFETLGLKASLVEWWQQVPRALPYTFQVTAWANDNRGSVNPALNPQLYHSLCKMLDEVKPARSHYEFITGSRFTQPLNIASTSNLATLSQFETEIKTPPLEFMQPLAAATTSTLFTLTRVAMEIQ